MAPTKSKASGKNVVTVKVKNPDPDVDPLVVSFPGGLPEGAQPNTSEPPPKFVLRKLREKAKRGRSLVGKDSTCEYKASNNGRGYDGRRTKLCVCILDKKRGVLTVWQAAERGHVFTMDQSVPTYEPADLSRKMDARERRKALFEDFGSAKKRKVLKSQEANVVKVESVVGAGSVMMGAFMRGQTMSESNRKAMEDSKKGTKQDAVELAYAEARRKFLPAFDADAKEPHQVYSASDIAGNDVWSRISRITDACIHKDNVVEALTEKGVWHDSVVTVLQAIPLDSPSAKFRIKSSMLLNYLVTFQLNKRQTLRGNPDFIARDLDLPSDVTKRFLESFMTPVDGHGRMRRYTSSKQNKDKTLVHILLLYIMCQGSSMKIGSIKPIVDELQVGANEAANLLREAGCRVQKVGNSFSAALQVPLTFPPPKRGGRGQS